MFTPDKVNVPAPTLIIPPVPLAIPLYVLLVLLASPIVSVLAPSAVDPAPDIESIVLAAAIVKFPALATPELAAMVPVALSASVPALMVVKPV